MKGILIIGVITVLLSAVSCKNNSADVDNTGGAPGDTVSTTVITKTFASDLAGVDLTVRYDAKEHGKEYRMEVSPLKTKLGADSSSIFMGFTGKKVRNFSVPGNNVDKVIHLTYKMAMTDKTDYIFLEKDSVFIIHTFSGAGGALASTTIYEIPKYTSGFDYISYFANIEKQYSNMVNANYTQSKTLFLYTVLFCEDNKLIN